MSTPPIRLALPDPDQRAFCVCGKTRVAITNGWPGAMVSLRCPACNTVAEVQVPFSAAPVDPAPENRT